MFVHLIETVHEPVMPKRDLPDHAQLRDKGFQSAARRVVRELVVLAKELRLDIGDFPKAREERDRASLLARLRSFRVHLDVSGLGRGSGAMRWIPRLAGSCAT